MAFNSLQYPAFLAVVLVTYYRFGRRGQNGVMLVAGSVFYALFDWRFMGLVYVTIAFAYGVSRALTTTESARARRGLLLVAIVSPLGASRRRRSCGSSVDARSIGPATRRGNHATKTANVRRSRSAATSLR